MTDHYNYRIYMYIISNIQRHLYIYIYIYLYLYKLTWDVILLKKLRNIKTKPNQTTLVKYP